MTQKNSGVFLCPRSQACARRVHGPVESRRRSVLSDCTKNIESTKSDRSSQTLTENGAATSPRISEVSVYALSPGGKESRMVLPSGEHEHNAVSVYALAYLLTVKNPGRSRIHRKISDRRQNLITSFWGRACPTPANIYQSRFATYWVILHTNGQTQSCRMEECLSLVAMQTAAKSSTVIWPISAHCVAIGSEPRSGRQSTFYERTFLSDAASQSNAASESFQPPQP